MKRSVGRTVIADNKADDFIGRETEIARLINHAEGLGAANGIALLSAPSAGGSELLRQVYDRLFEGQKDIIPVYFAVKESDATAHQAALRFSHEFLVQTMAFRHRDPGIINAPPDIGHLLELSSPDDASWIGQLVETLAEEKVGDERQLVKSCLSSSIRAAASGVNLFVMVDDLHNLLFLDGG